MHYAQAFLPNLFILGAAKCGTTTLHAHLSRMTDVCMSQPKEPFFFEAEFARGLGFYRQNYFSHWGGEPFLGDARHANLFLPWIPGRIAAMNPAAKLIVLVRDPVERAFSHWVHFRNAASEPLSFSEAIAEDWKRIKNGRRLTTPQEQEEHARLLGPNELGHTGKGLYRTYIDRGYYAEQIERYRQWFSVDQLKVYLFEELISCPEKIVNDIVNFLQLDPQYNRFEKDLWENPANVPGWTRRLYEKLRLYRLAPEFSRRWARRMIRRMRKSRTDRRIWDWLRDHFRIPNERLAELLGRDLSHWNQK